MPVPDYEDDLVFPPKDWTHLKYNHFVELTEKVKKQDEELQRLKENAARAAENALDVFNENTKLRQLLKECYVEIGEYMDSDNRLIQILRGIFENDTKID